MKSIVPILSVTGSDSTGGSGIQSDVKTIFSLGGYAVTAITAITVQNSRRIVSIENIPSSLVVSQVRSVFEEVRPKAVKVGLVRDAVTVRELANEIVGCRNIVLDLAFFSSRGEQLVPQSVVSALRENVFPITKLLILKCKEAELISKVKITTAADMRHAAQKILGLGPEAVLLQGGHCEKGSVTDILVVAGVGEPPLYFTSPDLSGWNYHGVAGTLSSAAATFLAKGEPLEVAVQKAHEYIRNLVVYSVAADSSNIIRHFHTSAVSSRQVEIYNHFLSLVAEHCAADKDVGFYTKLLSLTPRYLSQITRKIVGKPPKKIIDDYLLTELEETLASSSLTVQEIAFKFGFVSQASLSKFFKAQKGISPKEFRNQTI